MDVDWAPSVIELRKGSRETGEKSKERHARAKRRNAAEASMENLPPAKVKFRTSSELDSNTSSSLNPHHMTTLSKKINACERLSRT